MSNVMEEGKMQSMSGSNSSFVLCTYCNRYPCSCYINYRPFACEHCYCSEYSNDHLQCCKCYTTMHKKFVEKM